MNKETKHLDETMKNPGYNIGAVSSLTGISTDALRVWEKRYSLVKPERTANGNRVYSEQDLTRLSLIKKLLDAGDRVGNLAKLDIETLKARAANLQQERWIEHDELRLCRLVIASANLSTSLAEYNDKEEVVQLLACCDSVEQIATIKIEHKPDVLILELPSLNDSHINRITEWATQLGAHHAIIIYRFSNQKVLEKLKRKRFIPLRAPVDLATIFRHCDGILRQVLSDAKSTPFMMPVLGDQVPSRIYNDEILARMANISSTIKCECPQHLAELVMALSAFETYSTECENQNQKDAALHAYLHSTTAQARHIMEKALAHLIEVEHLTP